MFYQAQPIKLFIEYMVKIDHLFNQFTEIDNDSNQQNK